jgi:uncharacterized membrane protein
MLIFERLIMSFTWIVPQTSITLDALWAIATRTIITLFGIWCEERSRNHSIAPMRSVKILAKVNSDRGKLELLEVSGV